MSFWLLLAAFIVLGFGRLYLVDVFGRWSARRDAARFALDPRDRHRSVFHRQRLTWRGAVLTVLTAASWAPAWWLWPAAGAWLTLAWLPLSAAEFNATFTPALNQARGLPEHYVSRQPHAARFDRLICWWAARRGIPPGELLAAVLWWSERGALLIAAMVSSGVGIAALTV